jgi:hypothetical protein
MTAPILLQPKPQFSDENGKPYAGGLLHTYAKGTTTPKTTWKDPAQAAVNTNPITLDAAGRCDMWGDGDYQLELDDAAGNMIWNVPSTTVVSSAMYPAVSASTTTDALNYLGVTGAINTAITAEAAARHTEIVTATGTVQTNLDTFITNQTIFNETAAEVSTALVNYDTYLQAQINAITGGSPANYIQGGLAALTAAGSKTVTFAPAFASACTSVTCTLADTSLFSGGVFTSIAFVVTAISATSFTVATFTAGGSGGTGAASVPPLGVPPTFFWTALGH